MIKVKQTTITFVITLIIAGIAWADENLGIIQDINRQLDIPYVTCEANMTVIKKDGAKTKEYKLRLHTAVNNDNEKIRVEVLSPVRKKATLWVDRKLSGNTVAHIKLRDKKIRRRASRLSDVFLKSSLIDVDFKVLEDIEHYSFESGNEADRIVAKSKDVYKTFYEKKNIKVHKMTDGSWVEKEIEFFVDGKYVKKSVSSDFIEIKPGNWRPGKIVVENDKCITTLTFKNWQTSNTINERIFRLE